MACSLAYTSSLCCRVFFFFNDTATTEIYTLSLHDALPIYMGPTRSGWEIRATYGELGAGRSEEHTSELQSHSFISYAVFCLKKKKQPRYILTKHQRPRRQAHPTYNQQH